jgi:virginiamycin A acetyltransferase
MERCKEIVGEVLDRVPPLKRLVNRILRQRKFARDGIYVHPGTRMGYTSIGRGSHINGPAVIKASRDYPLTIGNYCAIGHHLTVITREHMTTRANMQVALQKRMGFEPLVASKGPVRIGSACWIGDNTTILTGVTVHDGAVIGAGSVVTKDLAPFSINVGNPARQVRLRFAQGIVEQLLALRWWDWSEDRMARNAVFFNADLSALAGDYDLAQLVVE